MTKNSACVMDTSANQETLLISQDSSSSDQEMELQSPQYFPSSTSQPQSFVQPMFKPYIKGPKMDWTVNDSLYHRFLKWKLKCENILDCELAMLPESKKGKKIIAWSRDFGMDQYVSWCLPNEDLNLDVIWSKYEYFCRPQTNEVRARFDLLTSSDKETDLVMSGAMQSKLKCLLPSTHQKLQVSCTEIYSVFFSEG